MPTYEETKNGYANLWNKAVIAPAHHAGAIAIAKKIKSEPYWSAFKEVQRITNVPAELVGCWLQRESSLDLNTYLGNGQSLGRVTTIVPKGRGPFTGPKAFVNGAVDAIKLQGVMGVKDWPLTRMLYDSERLNGTGYFGHHENSPYMWSWTNLAEIGKYTSDHGYDPTVWDPQPGVVAILKALAEIDPEIAARLTTGAAPAPTQAPAAAPTPAAPTAQPAGPATPSKPSPGTTPATQEKPMATPTPTPVATAVTTQTDPIPGIINFIEGFKGIFGGLAQLLPAQYKPIAQAAPTVIEEILQAVEDVKTKSGGNLAQSLFARFENVIAHGKVITTTMSGAAPVAPKPVQIAQPTGGATGSSEGMPNAG